MSPLCRYKKKQNEIFLYEQSSTSVILYRAGSHSNVFSVKIYVPKNDISRYLKIPGFRKVKGFKHISFSMQSLK